MKDFFYKLNERLSAIGGKKNLTESAAGAYPGDVPEHLDELTKDTLGSYIHKAASDTDDLAWSQGRLSGKSDDYSMDRKEKIDDKLEKRHKGIKRAVDRLTKEECDLDERAGPVGGGKWQDKMHLEEEADIESLISDLRKAYANINTIDPSSPTYKKLIDFLDGLDQEHLQILADAGVKFVSMLAKNRLKRSEKLDELSKDTLGSYAKKAHKSATGLATNAMHHMNTARELNNAGQRKDADKFYDYSTDATNKQIKRQKGIDRAVDKMVKESSDDWGLESWEDVVSAGLSMLNDGMPIRDILNMFRDEGFISSDNEVRDLIAALKNKGGSAMESRRNVNEISKDTATKYIKKASAGATDFEDVPEKRKKGVHTALKKKHGGAKVPATEGYRVIPKLDDEYEERQGLEGPFNANGRPIYYDPREGKYWDPKTDFYLDDEEAAMLFNESYEVVVEHKGKLKKIIVDLPKKKNK